MADVTIIKKFLSIMALFGLFVLATTFYATSQMRSINDGYRQLMAGDAKAALTLARANRSFETTRDGAAEIEIADTADENAAANVIFTDGVEGFVSGMDEAASLSPGHASEIDALKAQGQYVLDNQCAAAIKAGLAALTPAQALDLGRKQ